MKRELISVRETNQYSEGHDCGSIFRKPDVTGREEVNPRRWPPSLSREGILTCGQTKQKILGVSLGRTNPDLGANRGGVLLAWQASKVPGEGGPHQH